MVKLRNLEALFTELRPVYVAVNFPSFVDIFELHIAPH
jgi:hypothetical protein